MSTSVEILSPDTTAKKDRSTNEIGTDPAKPVSLGDVLEAERLQIEQIRKRRRECCDDKKWSAGPPRAVGAPLDAPTPGRSPNPLDKPEWQVRPDDEKWRKTIKKAHEANFVGLAFSGGGIRSATFNLGVLQALAASKLLYRVDYLSTVSGGGYIGGWLAAWTKRQARFKEVQEKMEERKLTSFGYTQTELDPNRVHQKEDNEEMPIRFLRVFSNYLTPKLGIFSGDTWAATATIARNLLLNLSVVLAGIVFLLLLPRLTLRFGIAAQHAMNNHEIVIGSVFGVLLLLALVVIANNVVYIVRGEKKYPRLTEQGWIIGLVSAPLFVDAIIGALWITGRLPSPDIHETIPYGWAVLAGAIAYFVICSLGIVGGYAFPNLWSEGRASELQLEEKKEPATESRSTAAKRLVAMSVSSLLAGGLAGFLYALLSEYASAWSARAALTFSVPLILTIFLLTATLQIGLAGRAFDDPLREWFGRLGGWLLLAALTWLAVFSAVLYFPNFVNHLPPWAEKLAKQYLTFTWIVTTGAGLLFAKGDNSGKPGDLNWRDWFVKAAPYLFVVGLVCWVSWGIDSIQQHHFLRKYLGTAQNGGGIVRPIATWVAGHRLWTALLGSAAFAAVMAWRVDINQFSMHLLYRNRLVRCYLGASNKERSPNLFTGFDETDDIALKDFAEESYDGPYPIFNATLNLVKGQDLAWQERKATSFIMTPKFCGYDVWLEEQDSPMIRRNRPGDLKKWEAEQPKSKLERFGYRSTPGYAVSTRSGQGLTLGAAMAVSGAAASPNMGFYSSVPVAFLMTIFNVRLGQWVGNPRHKTKWKNYSPGWGLSYLLKELLAGTTDDAGYVYLSDGGHFENLGLYELVKRRCGLIIVCDAEADNQYEFNGLANAIRKCQIDLGIEIELDVSEIVPGKASGFSKKHCAIGKIHYEQADVDAPLGTIIYFKASLTDNDPTDLKTYRKNHPLFPHESTIDQWFSESQFESYRKLGFHEVMTSIKAPEPAELPPAKTSLWSTLTAPVREALHFVGVDAPDQNNGVGKVKLEEQLGKVLDEFGFEVLEASTKSRSRDAFDPKASADVAAEG